MLNLAKKDSRSALCSKLPVHTDWWGKVNLHGSWLVSGDRSDSSTEFLDDELVGDVELLLDTATRLSNSVARRVEYVGEVSRPLHAFSVVIDGSVA